MTIRSTSVASAPRFTLLFASFALLIGCGGQTQSANAPQGTQDSGNAPASEAKPFDFEATIKREASGLTERGVQGQDAAWSAKVPAAAEPKLSRAEKVMRVEIPIGSESAVQCQIFDEALDPAGMLHGVLTESADTVEYRSIAPSGISLLGGVPSAFIETVYVTETEGGKAAGGLKLAIQARETESLLCMHDELGYRQTFKDVSSAFFASFKVRNAPPSDSTYTEMDKVRLGDIDVGFSWSRMKPGEKPGEREYSVSNSTLVPTSPKDVVFEDSYELYAYDSKNVLQSGTWVETSGGEVTLKVALERASDGKYAYEGEAGGKAIQGVFPAPKGVATSPEVASRLKKKLKAGGAFELVLSQYYPSLEPNALIDVKYSHKKGDPPRQVVMTMPDRVITLEVDDDGMTKSAWSEMGKTKLTLERLKSEGHL